MKFGKFTFLDLGDLPGKNLAALACPTNLIGHVDLYLVPHHGNEDSAIPAVIAAVTPRVAILNNGKLKGGDADAFSALRRPEGHRRHLAAAQDQPLRRDELPRRVHRQPRRWPGRRGRVDQGERRGQRQLHRHQRQNRPDENLPMKLTAVIFTLALAAGALAAGAAKTLDIYFIDVEGGQSTLIVTPAGQSLLIDAGYPGAQRPRPRPHRGRRRGCRREADRLPPGHAPARGSQRRRGRAPAATSDRHVHRLRHADGDRAGSGRVVCGLRGGAPARRASRAEARRPAAVPRPRRRRRERRRRDADAAARRRRTAESGVRGRRGRRTASVARTRGRSASASGTARSVFSISAT